MVSLLIIARGVRHAAEKPVIYTNPHLARAAGPCESCGKPAPFLRKNGNPYLEPHHFLRLADEGPDHPRWVGAVCPACHREIHHGVDGHAKNLALKQKLGALWDAAEKAATSTD